MQEQAGLTTSSQCKFIVNIQCLWSSVDNSSIQGPYMLKYFSISKILQRTIVLYVDELSNVKNVQEKLINKVQFINIVNEYYNWTKKV